MDFFLNGKGSAALILAISGVWFLWMPTSAAFAQNIEEVLQANGYQMYNPPRGNWGPGFVFAGDVIDNKISNVREVCPNLYGDLDAPNKTKVVLANHKVEDSFSLSVAFNYLKRVTGFANNDADLVSIEGKRAAEVTWGDINELSYSDMDKWLETGEARPIAKRCRAAIDDLKAKNRFKDHVFVIVRAVAPDFVTFDFSEALKGGVGVSAGFSQRLSAGIRGKGEFKEASRLEIKERLFVGYAPPFKIDDWLPTGFVSGEIVEVRGKPSTLVIE